MVASFFKTISIFLLFIIILFFGMYWLERVNFIPTAIATSIVDRALTYRGLSNTSEDVVTNALLLDQIRLEKKEERIAAMQLELSRQSQLLEVKSIAIVEAEAAIAEERTNIEEQKKTINQNLNYLENKNMRVRQVAESLVNMPPENAVEILTTFEDELMIDVLLAVGQIAEEGGTPSIVPFWLSLMPPERAGKVQDKLVNSR